MANRPRGVVKRSEVIRFKATPEEKMIISRYAELTEHNESDFIRLALQAQIDKLMREHMAIH